MICLDSLLEIGARSAIRTPMTCWRTPRAGTWSLNATRAGRDLGHHRVRHDDVQHARAHSCPRSAACTSNLGTARVYNINYTNAAPQERHVVNRSEIIVGGGLPPSPVAGMVTLDDGTTMPFLIGGDPNSPLEGLEPIPSGLAEQPKALTYWYIHK